MPDNYRHPRRDRDVYNEIATGTRVIIAFHSDNGFDGIVNGYNRHIGRIVSVQTSKSFGGASGSFSITIKKPPHFGSTSLLRLFPDPEGTWVRISFIVDGTVISTMWGNVDTVSESTGRSGNGARAETYTITGRDIGKVFEETKVFFMPYTGTAVRSLIGTMNAVANQALGPTPDMFVRQYIELWLGTNRMTEKVWELPRSMWNVAGTSFYDALNRSTIQCMNEGNGLTFDNTGMSPQSATGQALWDVLQQYANGCLNEMWVDLAPRPWDLRNLAALEPAIYLRERMFPTASLNADGTFSGEFTRRWNKLRTRILNLQDIQSRQVARGGAANRHNYWELKASFLGSALGAQYLAQDLGARPFRPGSMPIVNAESIRKFGVRPFFATTNFCPINDPERQANFLVLASNWLKKMHDWYGVAHMELTGTLSTSRIFPEIRIGERVVEKRHDGDITYYVEGVDHSWAYPGAGSTHITVTHGAYEGEELLERLYAEYEVPEVVTQDECTDEIDPDLDDLDEVVAQLAAGCRFGVGPDFTAELTGENVTEDQILEGNYDNGVNASGAGLVQEGATPIECLMVTPDPEMIPSIDDAEAVHARQIVEGTTTNTAPDLETDAEVEDATLTQDALEGEQPISTPEDDPFAGIDWSSDDPLEGILDQI